jgi:hypothetical protein
MSERGRGRGFQVRGRGRFQPQAGGRGGGRQRPDISRTPAPTTTAVPILRPGPDTNFIPFKRLLSREAIELYGDLGFIIDQGKYTDIIEPDFGEYKDEDDPHGFVKAELIEDMKEAKKLNAKRRESAPKFYAYIWGKLSKASQDEVATHESFNEFSRSKEPLELWLAIEATHRVQSVSKAPQLIKKASKDAYNACKQNTFESIIDYHERYCALRENFETLHEDEMNDKDAAMDFLTGLDDGRYAEFKVEYMNDLSRQKVEAFESVAEVYEAAKSRLSVSLSRNNGGPVVGAAYATTDSMTKGVTKKYNKKPGKAKQRDHEKDESSEPKERRKAKSTIECYNCGKLGHYAKECRAKPADGGAPTAAAAEDDETQDAAAHVTWAAYATNTQRHENYEVCLDDCSEVSVIHSKFLTNIRDSAHSFAGLSGIGKKSTQIGHLAEFFDCIVCDDCSANILCEADIEDMYNMTIIQGVSKTVHLPSGDLTFYRKGKFYVADMTDWIVESQANLTTVQNNEDLYTMKEVKKARAAQEFIANCGYPSLREVLHLLNDGNIAGSLGFSDQDVHRAYDIYGPPRDAVRGKMTSRKLKRDTADPTMKEQRTDQVLYTDVMKVGGQSFLVTLAEPLLLTITSAIRNEESEHLGVAIEVQLSLLRSRGFNPIRIYVDPQRGFLPLVGKFPGVEFDITGAGDHLDKVDAKIRRIKELIRSVHSSLPWNIPDSRVPDLVTYATSRINTRRTSAIVGNVAPRVKFTGRRLDPKEFKIGFGDYCECRDPKVTSNEALQDRSEPCIALFPTANATGAWIFLNLKTNRTVRRTVYMKMVTTPLVIARMNELANKEKKKIQGLLGEEAVTIADEQPILPVTHTPTQVLPSPVSETEAIASADETHRNDENSADREDPIGVEAQQDRGGENIDTDLDIGVHNMPPERASARIAAGVRRPPRFIFHTSLKRGIREHGKHALDAIMAEMRQLFKEKKALRPVSRSELSKTQIKKIIRSSMFLKEKFDARGKFEKLKARLVADGRQQNRALYPNNASPTVSVESLIMCLYIAARQRRKAAKVDITGAYLNAPMTGEEVIMELDRTLTEIISKYLPEMKSYESNGKLLVRLDRALYGCVQSAKLWYDMLTNVLREAGFVANPTDPCVLNAIRNGKQITLVVYVDDIMILTEDDDNIEWVYKTLCKEFDDVKIERGNDLSYLGMHIVIKDGVVEMSMEAFIDEALKEYGADVTARNTPATAKLFDLIPGEELNDNERKKFHTQVMRLLYLAQRLRQDILLPVLFLCTRVKCPTREDNKKLDRVFGYLKQTKGLTKKMRCRDEARLIAYIDASFGLHFDGKSHSGCCIMIGDACIWCSSKKQKIVTKDSTEAELVSLQEMLLMVEKCQEFMENQGFRLKLPLILQDNTSTITLVSKGGGKYRNKHLRAKQGWVHDKVSKGEIEIKHIGTANMLADAFTKPLQGEHFKSFVARILGWAPRVHSLR